MSLTALEAPLRATLTLSVIPQQQADALFGEKAMTEICESGMTVDMLSLLVQKTFALINGVEDFDEEDGQELSDEDSRSKLPGDAAKK